MGDCIVDGDAIAPIGEPARIAEPMNRVTSGFHPWDERFPRVAAWIAETVSVSLPDLPVEHIGSTAVPGCPGKGVVDLLVPYPAGRLEDVKALLLALGFCRLSASRGRPWPAERPVFIGRVHFEGAPFPVYVHVVPEGSSEVRRFRIFRDRLITDSELLARYARVKQEIIARGVTHADEYSEAKDAIITEILS